MSAIETEAMQLRALERARVACERYFKLAEERAVCDPSGGKARNDEELLTLHHSAMAALLQASSEFFGWDYFDRLDGMEAETVERADARQAELQRRLYPRIT